MTLLVHPDNPHYFVFRGKPIVLITSAEHYGAVINREFDYVAYLDALAAFRLNATRIYPGGLIEREGDFIAGNTLAPRSDALLLPWARSDVPGYAQGGAKFDLDRWDNVFFERLRDFVEQASRLGIVVEVCFFNAQYPERWPLQALYHANNVQGVSACDHVSFQTMRDPALVRRQADYVAEIVRQLNVFDNVMYEICDEPGLWGTPASEYGAWIGHLIDVVRQTEAQLPNRHVIAQQVMGDLGGPGDFSSDPRVDVLVGQYVMEDEGQQIGGIRLLETSYDHNKPIELNETAYYPVWYTEDREAASRVEAWEFIIGGGASFNQLNGVYTVFNPRGDDPNNLKVLGALKNLRNFVEQFDVVRMRRAAAATVSGVPVGARAQCINEPGRQYAFYLHRSLLRGNRYVTVPGLYQDTLVFDVPDGTYHVAWHSPETGSVLAGERIRHWGGALTLRTPGYRTDIALSIVRET